MFWLLIPRTVPADTKNKSKNSSESLFLLSTKQLYGHRQAKSSTRIKMALLDIIEQRSSIRSYKEKAIPEEVLRTVLEAGRRAPSAKNRQTWRFICITDPDTRKKISEAAYGEEYIEHAPALIVFCTTNIDYTMPNGQKSHPIDLAIAASFMMLQAEHESLGSCLVTTFNEVEVKELLTVPHSMRAVLLMTLGYPEDRPLQSPRKPFKRVISFNHW
jgi:nitroreductase